MRLECNPCPANKYRSNDMFSYQNDAKMRPPAVVTTMGQLKQQYKEPDWCPPPQQQQQKQQQQWRQQQQQQQQPRDQVERREQYWGGNARGGNSLVADERDSRMPTNNFQYPSALPTNNYPSTMPTNNFQYSSTMGRALSPRQHQYQAQQQQLSSREVSSYKAAIKAVNDSMNADRRGGNVTALRGLWKVFDAAVSELGTELTDSLSNKAIFEANVNQEALLRQGRQISDFEKKSDAISRKNQYEASLKSTMLRLRGSFADVILGTKKEIQGSIDKSFAMKAAEMELNMEKTFAKSLSEKEKMFAKMSLAKEEKIDSANKENSRLHKDLNQAKQAMAMVQAQLSESSKRTTELEKQAERSRDSANMEIERLHNDVIQANQEKAMVQAQLSEYEQRVNIVQAQMTQERESYRQTIANSEQNREDAVAKLSSTLETLQNTCTSAHNLEVKLTETEEMLSNTQERLQHVERQRRQEHDAANQQWSIENERANLLQKKLDSEVKNKNGLINVQKEMEKHLGLERERGDLLQQELHAETQSKEEMVRSLQDADRQRREELDRASRDNMHLRDHMKTELERASQENSHVREQVKRANDVSSSLKANLNGLQAKFEEQVGALHEAKAECSQLANEFQTCKDRLEKTSEMNSLLEAKADRLEAKVQDQVMDLEAARMSEADVETSLAESLQRGNELEADLRHARTEMQQRVGALEARLRHTVTEMQTLAQQIADECRQKDEVKKELGESKSEVDALKNKLTSSEQDYSQLRNLNIGLEAETEALKDKLSRVEEDYGKDRLKISTALAGFDEEITNAESKLKSVMDELEKEKTKVKELAEAQEAVVNKRAMDEENLKQKTEEEKKALAYEIAQVKQKAEEEKKALSDEIEKVKAEGSKQCAKYEADIGVYGEAIKMLQKQVDILGEMADNAEECEQCANSTKMEESKIEKLKDLVKQEARQEFLSRLNSVKSELKEKDSDIAALREKCQRREEAMEKLEKLCAKARKELLRLSSLKQTQVAMDPNAMDAVEFDATPRSSRKGSVTFHEDVTFRDFDDICVPIVDSTSDRAMPGHPTSCKDIGSELDAILNCIEAQLGINNCGAPAIKSQAQKSRGKEDGLATRSW